MWFVYVIRSIKSNYRYIGSTNNLKRRIEEHNSGLSKATLPYKPFELEAYVAVNSEAKARALEKYFKTGSGKAVLYKRILTNGALA